jgi:signal transduction histidine kinase
VFVSCTYGRRPHVAVHKFIQYVPGTCTVGVFVVRTTVRYGTSISLGNSIRLNGTSDYNNSEEYLVPSLQFLIGLVFKKAFLISPPMIEVRDSCWKCSLANGHFPVIVRHQDIIGTVDDFSDSENKTIKYIPSFFRLQHIYYLFSSTTMDLPPVKPIHQENRSVNNFSSLMDLKVALTSVSAFPSETKNGEADHSNEQNMFLSQALQAKHLLEVAETTTSVFDNSPDDMEEMKDPSQSSTNPSDYDWVLENYDKNTTQPQCLEDEMRRLLVLKSYLILDAEREEVFETITGLASRLFNCSIALVSLIDLGRQWFMSNRGLDDVRETSRKTAFCSHAIMSTEDLFIVKDATKDVRFKDNPLVTGPPDIRFYAGAPLMSPEGFKLGTLCVIDSKPRPFGLDLEEKQNLKELADMTVQAMTRRRRRLYAKHNDPAQVVAQIAHDLLTPLTGVQLSLATLTEDETLGSKLTAKQQETLSNASQCSDAVEKICATAITELRKHEKRQSQTKERLSDTKGKGRKQRVSAISRNHGNSEMDVSIQSVKTKTLVDALYTILDSFPKNVPVTITVNPDVPEELSIDELKVFRAALNYLSNACSRTISGSIQLSIHNITDDDGFHRVMFECVDTAPNIPVEQYPFLFKPIEYDDGTTCIKPAADGECEPICRIQTTGLGLYSVAMQIGSLGGEYGFRPREEDGSPEGSNFWFKVPLFANGAKEMH